MTHTTEDWHNSPLPEGMSHAITVPPGGGGWALWRPLRTDTDRNLQSGRDNSEAMAVQGAQEAMAGGPCGRGLGPLSPAPTAGTLLPPKKISLGKLGGIRSPPGLDTDKQDSPQEQEALLGELGSWGFFWAWQDISGRPAGLSQRRAGGVGWAANGGTISRERRAWVSRGRRRELPRTAGWVLAASGLATIPPNSHASSAG